MTVKLDGEESTVEGGWTALFCTVVEELEVAYVHLDGTLNMCLNYSRLKSFASFDGDLIDLSKGRRDGPCISVEAATR